MTIFKACDVRGVVGPEWDVRDAQRIGAALAEMLLRRGQSTIVVGGDFRRSTPRLKAALIEGLRHHEVAVCDVGQAPTPVIQFAARAARCRNLAIVTASHNPGKYNGVKFLVDGWPPVPALIQELQSQIARERPARTLAPLQSALVTDDYAAWVGAASLQFATSCLSARGEAPPEFNPQQRRIIIDTMGGAFTSLAPQVLRAAGHEVVSLDDQLDPDFARRTPNPAVDANLRSLQQATAKNRPDMALALDGDGDRVIFLDQLGTIARPEQIAAILLRHCLGASTIVYDLKCASVVAHTAQELGGNAIMQPSGHGFIKRKLLEQRAELGVEVSGHHFFGVLEGGDDGLFTALVLLHLLDLKQGSLKDWLAEVGWPSITPDLRIPYSGDATSLLEHIAATCGGTVRRMDGVRAQYEDGGWALARASITEPAITFRFEGRDKQHLREIAQRFLATEAALSQYVMEKI